MPTYNELISQAQALMQQAEQVRKQEQANVISSLRATMKEHGITIEDLAGTSVRKSGGVKSRSKAPAKYRGPNGELWSGGPGRKPEWVKAALAAGQNLDSFRI